VKHSLAAVVGNCVFGTSLRDPWAAFALPVASYDLLRDDQKIARLHALSAALEATQSEFQLLRIADARGEDRRETAVGADTDLATVRDAYVAAQLARTESPRAGKPRLFMFVSLRESAASALRRTALGVSPTSLRSVAVGKRGRVISARRLEDARLQAERVQRRIGEHLELRPATSAEVQWVLRRSYSRAVVEPELDAAGGAAPLAFEMNGEAVISPLDGVHRTWSACHVTPRLREVVVHSEFGSAHQATLMFGALPEAIDFPGAETELMFRPMERLAFPVDVSLNARYLSNAAAVRLVRRRLQDANQIVHAEAEGEQGASDAGLRRSDLARALLAELQSGRVPPLFRVSVAVAVAARDRDELDERVDACRRSFAPVRLHRPVADQLRALSHHIPAQRGRVPGYDQVVTAHQIAALMPTAAEETGSESGFYLGHTLTNSRRVVRFNLRDGSDGDQNTAILCVGALGTGKTTLAQKLCYEALLQGARVVDCDPKGDHRLHLLDEIAPHAELLTVRPERSLRGLLDPLRVTPPHLRHDATVEFLRAILPMEHRRAWGSAVLAAVDRVISTCELPTCTEVIRAVRDAGQTTLAEMLEVHARSGLTQLAFADADTRLPAVGERPFTYIAIRDLPGPPIGTPRAQYSHSENVGEQIVRLVALLSMHLLSSDRARLKVYAFDEGWRLLSDPIGRTLLTGLQRMGRSELAVPIISTQLISDAHFGNESAENLVGPAFVFGMRADREAGRALRMLGLDADERSVERLLGMRAGRCLFRDHRGRVTSIQVDVVPDQLRRALSTTPPRESSSA